MKNLKILRLGFFLLILLLIISLFLIRFSSDSCKPVKNKTPEEKIENKPVIKSV